MSPAHRSLADPYCNIIDTERKPSENCSLGKNPLKYTTANVVQQSNCRWHCERSCLLGYKSIHTLPLQSPHLLSLHL
jgi:hypothetical protein